MSFGDDLCEGLRKKPTGHDLIPKLLSLETVIDYPIIISYIIELHHIKFGLRVGTSNLKTFIRLVFSKTTKLQLQLLLKLKSHFLDRFEGNWVWEVRG